MVGTVDGSHRRLPEEASLDGLLAAEDPLTLAAAWFSRGVETDPPIDDTLLAPIGSQEVWAAGVTYLRSKAARVAESLQGGSDRFYDLVYEAERPELFLKATARRVVGPNGAVRIREDSAWNVPEPELTLVVDRRARIVGHTIGNDMSSRSIEAANPLYLPQAKIYTGAAAIGPRIVLSADPHTGVALTILRANETVFAGTTTLGHMVRSFDDLVAFLFRDNDFPVGVLLMTGTGIVPADDFTLAPGDEIRIAVDGVGTLVNHVSG
jgi:2-dehydro-3-deoxy-D-arabinonate dehydratase